MMIFITVLILLQYTLYKYTIKIVPQYLYFFRFFVPNYFPPRFLLQICSLTGAIPQQIRRTKGQWVSFDSMTMSIASLHPGALEDYGKLLAPRGQRLLAPRGQTSQRQDKKPTLPWVYDSSCISAPLPCDVLRERVPLHSALSFKVSSKRHKAFLFSSFGPTLFCFLLSSRLNIL